MDLTNLSIASAAPKSFQNPVEKLDFDLVIPANTLDPSSKYMFRLVGIGSCPTLVASQTIEILTRSGPFDGRLEVTSVMTDPSSVISKLVL